MAQTLHLFDCDWFAWGLTKVAKMRGGEMQIEGCFELKGMQVISLEEGAALGTVQDIFMNPDLGKLSSVSFKEHIFGKSRFIEFENIDRIGEAVIFVNSKSFSKVLDEENQPDGQNVKMLQGMWVTTQDGEHIGNLIDVDFDRSNWLVTDIYLSNGEYLPITGINAKFGKDEILVPSSSRSRLKKIAKGRRGLLDRLLGGESAQQISAAIQRTMKGFRKETSLPHRPQSTEPTVGRIGGKHKESYKGHEL